MQTWGLTDPGNIRQQNQDSYAIVPFGRDRVLMIVCDGMGGAKSGNVASSLAVEVFTDEVRRTQRPGMTPEKAAAMLRSALELSNSAVYEQSQLSDDFTGMGTYHFTREDVRLITRDHSMVAYMVERGELTQEQAKLHPGKNVITRAVGTEPEVEGDIFTCRLRRDECILLCSDGLSNEMADQEMLFEVVHGLSKSDCCQRLLHIAKNRGAPDNVTVTLAAV